MRNKTVFVVLGLAAAGGLFLLLLVAAVIAISFTGVSSREISGDEKQQLANVDDLAPYHQAPGDRSLCESYVAKRNLDGSLELEYEYDTDKDTSADGYLFFKAEAEINSSDQTASESFRGRITAYKTGMKLVSGRTLDEQPSLFSLGEENYAAIVFQDGNPVGNLVVSRRGDTVYSLVLFGVWFDDQQALESVLRRAIQSGS